jgi:hypothetical protein
MSRQIVFGLHNFIAEEADEISFGVGEPIIVLERDDQFQDGWWKVLGCLYRYDFADIGTKH